MIAISMRKYSTIVLAILVIWPLKFCSLTALEGFQFDVNDILDQKLMPTRLFTQPFTSFLNLRNVEVIRRNGWPNASGSNFSTALTTMTFHRRMMNEYLATSFLVQQLLAPSKLIWVKRRMGKIPTANENFNTSITNSFNKSAAEGNNRRNSRHLTNHKLLMDEGSANYKDWLERSTLDDIRRHFKGEMLSNQSSMYVTKHHNVRNNRRNDEGFVLDQNNIVVDNEEYEDGDITGYALTNNFPETSQSRFISPNHLYLPNGARDRDVQPSSPYAQIVNKNGYESAYDSYNVHSPQPQSHAHQHYRAPSYQTPHPPLISAVASVNGTEISLKDITDIALTTLAFLSFGMFILQILICITMGKDDSANMMMLPMEGGDGAADIPDDGVEEIRRRKRRSVHSNGRFIAMNFLARRVLHSIDAVLLIPKDKGSCHYLSICEHNQFARKQFNGQRLWIPVWSLGLSWLTSHMFTNDTTGYEYDFILKSLKAIVIGAGNDKCKQYYGQGCRFVEVGNKSVL